ncbi:MAG: ferrochelatase, partial [Polyangia bacterium]|nr:ferrochelatase [Polyangia bacterium]
MPDPWRQDRGEPGRRAAGETRREDHGLASRPPAGVVAMAMGGPARPEEVRPFLRALFADPDLIQAPLGPLRRPFAHLMATLREKGARRRYGLVGGSPLVEETRLQVAALESELLKDGLPVELALAYGFPGPSDALASLRARGVRLVLGLPMYPQWSRATSGASLRALERALHGLQPSPGNDVAPMSLREVGPFPSRPGFIGPLAAQAREAMDRARSRGL